MPDDPPPVTVTGIALTFDQALRLVWTLFLASLVVGIVAGIAWFILRMTWDMIW